METYCWLVHLDKTNVKITGYKKFVSERRLEIGKCRETKIQPVRQ